MSDIVKKEVLPPAVRTKFFGARGKSAGYSEDFLKRIKIPFLRIANAGADVLKKENSAYITGLEAGDYYNDLSAKIIGDTPEVIMLGYFVNYTKWGVDAEGNAIKGDFHGTINRKQFLQRESEYTLDPKLSYVFTHKDFPGIEIRETHNYLLVETSQISRSGMMLLAVSGTSLAFVTEYNSNALLHEIDDEPVPIFAPVWKITKEVKVNPQNSWYIPALFPPTKENPFKGFQGFVPDLYPEKCDQVLALYDIAQEYIQIGAEFDYAEKTVRPAETEETQF